ncbi:MAG: aminotransferase class I/II-fold pyridoxal phosphate-dependent enzyme [Sphingomonadales bacterium]|nr:aminotransferase class I/II-fold pyridoxal phosphate-dependent enzyme [Sphingomonadales bacterium]
MPHSSRAERPSAFALAKPEARKNSGPGRMTLGPASPHSAVIDADGQTMSGLNFAVQDYLSLSGHPLVRAAATAALEHHHLAAGGSASHLGLSVPLLALEARVARFLRLQDAAVFSSGAEANRITLRNLLAPGDTAIVDHGSHPAMFEAVLAAGATPLFSPAGSVEAVERRLRRLAPVARGRLLVTAPAISAYGSVVADVAGLLEQCRHYRATLVIDAAHDLGSVAPGGGGIMELQGCLGRADVVVGSFAKTFGAAGGFAAFRDPALKTRLRQSRFGQRQSAALSAVNASVILAAFDLVESAEGRMRRRRLRGHAQRLRNHLLADGFSVMGAGFAAGAAAALAGRSPGRRDRRCRCCCSDTGPEPHDQCPGQRQAAPGAAAGAHQACARHSMRACARNNMSTEEVVPVTLTINSERVVRMVPTRQHLVDFLRIELGLTGAHLGCEHGVCGACSVRVDGVVVRGCLMLAVQADGSEVMTIEGLTDSGEVADLQDAFVQRNALQCGFCTPGMVMTAAELLREHQPKTREEIRTFLSGNYCRCTGYHAVVDAVATTLERRIKGDRP